MFEKEDDVMYTSLAEGTPGNQARTYRSRQKVLAAMNKFRNAAKQHSERYGEKIETYESGSLQVPARLIFKPAIGFSATTNRADTPLPAHTGIKKAKEDIARAITMTKWRVAIEQ